MSNIDDVYTMLQKKMPNDKDSSGETVGNELWRQCWRGDVDAVKKALQGGTDVNEVKIFYVRMVVDGVSQGWER